LQAHLAQDTIGGAVVFHLILLRKLHIKGDFTAGMVSIMVSFEQVGGYCNASTIAQPFFHAICSPKVAMLRKEVCVVSLKNGKVTQRGSSILTHALPTDTVPCTCGHHVWQG
jgi:hypothetical protein